MVAEHELAESRPRGDERPQPCRSRLRNVPWEGHANTVVARVTNRGSSPARGVKVQFFSKDFTFGGGYEVPLGEQTQDIPVGATVTFTAPQTWSPTTLPFPLFGFAYQQHACLVARIAPFLDPVSNIWEVTSENNEAQSNYTWMATTTSSPATRESAIINAENTLDEPAYVYFTIHQPHPLYRIYLDHRWVFLQPGERRPILVMVESLLGDLRFDKLAREFQHGERRIMTTVRLSALGDTRATCTATVLGGAAILAIVGHRHGFPPLRRAQRPRRGLHRALRHGRRREWPRARVDRAAQTRRRRTEILREVDAQDGRFVVEVGEAKNAHVQAHYLGQYPYGPSESRIVEV